MILSDRSILKFVKQERIKITPFDETRVQPTSYDISLSNDFRSLVNRDGAVIDPFNLDLSLTLSFTAVQICLKPGEFILGSTVEYIELCPEIAARIEGKSSLGRLGLTIHTTAGWIDPGFRGNVTLELKNDAPLPIILRPGMLIGQLAFMRCSTTVLRPYGAKGLGSKYQDSVGTVESKL